MVDGRVNIEFGQPFVDMLGPAFAPLFKLLGLVPCADLLPKAIFIHFAHGQHDMGMGLGEAVRADVPMDIEVGDHTALDKFSLHKVASQVDALLLGQLTRNREFDFARKLRVFP